MLRLLDFGRVAGLRSQTWWHAVAEAMRPTDAPVLALMTPAQPYVSIGFHRRADEIDLAACAARGLALFRRRAGGGPVLCDEGQLFFQLIAPTASLPAVRERAWQRALGPAVSAFRALGVNATLAPGNDMMAGDRKISGTGAAQIGDATVFVGNVIFKFDYAAMADILALPAAAKVEAERLMRRYLGPVGDVAGRSISREEAVAALFDCYADAFGGITPSAPTQAEEQACARLDRIFGDPAWVFAERAAVPPRIKIRTGVSLLSVGSSWVSVVDDRVDRACIGGTDAGRQLAGVPVEVASLREAMGDWAARDELLGAIVDAYSRGA